MQNSSRPSNGSRKLQRVHYVSNHNQYDPSAPARTQNNSSEINACLADYGSSFLCISVDLPKNPHSIVQLDFTLKLEDRVVRRERLRVQGQTGEQTVRFEGLLPSSFYQLAIVRTLQTGVITSPKHMMVFTGAQDLSAIDKETKPPQQNPKSIGSGLCEAEVELISRIGEADPYLINLAGGKKALRDHIMSGRKARGQDSYVNLEYKYARPAHLHKQRLGRAIVMGLATTFGDHHLGGTHPETSEKSMRLGQNCWGMGPFYAHNTHYRDLREKYADN